MRKELFRWPCCDTENGRWFYRSNSDTIFLCSCGLQVGLLRDWHCLDNSSKRRTNLSRFQLFLWLVLELYCRLMFTCGIKSSIFTFCGSAEVLTSVLGDF